MRGKRHDYCEKITIPDEVLETIKLPKRQAEKELKKELAFLLYERELASIPGVLVPGYSMIITNSLFVW